MYMPSSAGCYVMLQKFLMHFWNQCFFACLEPIEHITAMVVLF